MIVIEAELTYDELMKAAVEAVAKRVGFNGHANCRVEFTSVRGGGVTAKVRMEVTDPPVAPAEQSVTAQLFPIDKNAGDAGSTKP